MSWFEAGAMFLITFFCGFILRTWFRLAGYRTSLWPALAALVFISGVLALNVGLPTERMPPLLCGFFASWAGMFLTRKSSWEKRDRYMPPSSRRLG